MFVVRTRLQTEALHQPAHRMSSIAAVTKELYRDGGLRIFWRGMTANLIGKQGSCFRQQGQLDQAIRCYREAQQIYQQLGLGNERYWME